MVKIQPKKTTVFLVCQEESIVPAAAVLV